MADQTSIIDIQVSDSSFQSYLASLQDYRKLTHESEAELQEALADVNAARGGAGQGNARYRKSLRLTIEAGHYQQDTVTADISLAPQDAGHLSSWRHRLNLQTASDLLLQRTEEIMQDAPDMPRQLSTCAPSGPLSSFIPVCRPFLAEPQKHGVSGEVMSASRTETDSRLTLIGRDWPSIMSGDSTGQPAEHRHAAEPALNMSQGEHRHAGQTTTRLNILPPVMEDMSRAGPDGLTDRVTVLSETSSTRKVSLKILPEISEKLPAGQLEETGMTITGQTVPTTEHSLWATGAGEAFPSSSAVPDSREKNIPAAGRLTAAATVHDATPGLLSSGMRGLTGTVHRQDEPGHQSDQQAAWTAEWVRLGQRLDRYHDDREKALVAYDWKADSMSQDTRQWLNGWQASLLKGMTDCIPQILNSIQTNTVIHIENHGGQDLAIAARQGAGI